MAPGLFLINFNGPEGRGLPDRPGAKLQNVSQNPMKETFLTFVLSIFLLTAYPQWIPINQDTTFMHNCVHFLNMDTGYVVGSDWFNSTNGVILRTLNGGQTWDTTLINGNPWFMILAVPSADVAYTGGQDGAIYKTVNGGVTWAYTGTLPYMFDDCVDIFFLNDTIGFALDILGKVFKTINGALSWAEVYSPASIYARNYFPNTGKFHFVNSSIAYVANGDSGLILKSVDGGNVWSEVSVGNVMMKVNSIFMLNADTGFAVGDNGKITRTTSGGNSWLPVSQLTSTNKDLIDITFFSDSVGYIVGGRDLYTGSSSDPYHGLIYRTIDGGLTWTADDSLCCNWLTAIYSLNDSVGYAVGWKGRILKISNAGYNSSVIDIDNAIDNSMTIYPNPFSIQATIWSASQLQNATLLMHSSHGQNVREISGINGQTVILKRDNLADGLYFIRLTQDNKVIATKKLVIIH